MSPHEVFRSDDRAVSPAMATAFMIGVAVIAAGAVGIMILDLGDSLEDRPPQVAFTLAFTDDETNGDELVITHVAGDELPKETIELQVRNAEVFFGDDTERHSVGEMDIDWAEIGMEDQSPGKTVLGTEIRNRVAENEGIDDQFWDDIHLNLDETTIRIVWHGGSRSMVLDEWTGPDA